MCSVYGSLTRVYTRGVHSKWGCWQRGPLPARAMSPLVDSVPDGARRRFRPVGPIRVCARVTAPHLQLQSSRGGPRTSPAAATRPSWRVWAIEKRARSRTSARHTGHLSTWVVKHAKFWSRVPRFRPRIPPHGPCGPYFKITACHGHGNRPVESEILMENLGYQEGLLAKTLSFLKARLRPPWASRT